MTASDWRAIGAAVAVVVGAFVGQRAGSGSGSLAAFGAVVVGGVALCMSRSRWRSVAIGCALALVGTASMQRALHGLDHHSMRAAVVEGRSVVLGGELAGDPRPTRFATTALVRVATWRSDGRRANSAVRLDRTVLVHASGREAQVLATAVAGDHLEVVGDLVSLHGFDAAQRWRHAVARLDVREEIGRASCRERV